ncbi:PhoP regulatory network protein YrbL [compost metagenome]
MIDGLGSSTFLPFKMWIRAINLRSKRKRIDRLRKRLEGRLAAYRAGKPIP